MQLTHSSISVYLLLIAVRYNRAYSLFIIAPSPAPMGRPGLRGSEITLYGESGCPPTATRPKVKTNGHFTTFMQSRQDLTSSGSEWPSPTRLPKTRPSNPKTGSGPQQLLQQQQQDAMSQSCPTPTPPQGRRRFFLSPKALRSPFSQRASGRQQRAHEAMSGKIAIKYYMVYKTG